MAREQWKIVYPATSRLQPSRFPSQAEAYRRVDPHRRRFCEDRTKPYWTGRTPVPSLLVYVDEGSGWELFERVNFHLEQANQ